MELRYLTQKIQTVNLAQVNQAAHELLHLDKIVVVIANPAVLADGGSRLSVYKILLGVIFDN